MLNLKLNEFGSYKLSPESTCSCPCAVDVWLLHECLKKAFLPCKSVPGSCSENSIEQLGGWECGM
jgi:hypothetical protein